MRNALIAASLLAGLVAGSGCIGCSLGGGGNQVYERESEMLILCDNGGFVAVLGDTMVEGLYSQESGIAIATKGEDGQVAFELTDNGDGTSSAPQLGATAWTAMPFDELELDKSNVLCDDLQFRSWWPTAQQ